MGAYSAMQYVRGPNLCSRSPLRTTYPLRQTQSGLGACQIMACQRRSHKQDFRKAAPVQFSPGLYDQTTIVLSVTSMSMIHWQNRRRGDLSPKRKRSEKRSEKQGIQYLDGREQGVSIPPRGAVITQLHCVCGTGAYPAPGARRKCGRSRPGRRIWHPTRIRGEARGEARGASGSAASRSRRSLLALRDSLVCLRPKFERWHSRQRALAGARASQCKPFLAAPPQT